ncbi:MAG: FecR domain-containing protein [Steroidobacteraceae bacterium]|nr:FecR domain-containing protein [Steroidobacteraceae bacterium]
MSDPTNNDAAAERALREGFKAKGLSPEALQRIRQATEKEWRSVPRAPARRGWRSLAAAASIAVLAVGLGGAWFTLNGDSADGEILGELASFDAPGIVETRTLRRDVAVGAGAKLRAMQRLDVRGDSLVSLAEGGNLRLARATIIHVEAGNTISLERGELYVDIPPGSHGSGAFRVVTEAGEFRHEGTQFAVAIFEGQTRLRVREGRVRWLAAAGESTVPAGTEVIIDRSGKTTQRPIATAGRDWAWTESMTPEIAIDERPLMEFLEWFARETGRKLVIDDAARRQAASIRMHGNVNGLTVTEALSAVMATTTLRYELREGILRVSSTSEPKTPA